MIKPGDTYWELRAGEVVPEIFFELLTPHFPEATTLFVEGTDFGEDILRLLRAHGSPGEFTPGANTIWPESTKLRCRFSEELAGDLARLAKRHGTPEIGDHLFLYRDRDFLIYWHDAFDNAAYLAPELPVERVSAFASAMGCGFNRVGRGAGGAEEFR